MTLLSQFQSWEVPDRFGIPFGQYQMKKIEVVGKITLKWEWKLNFSKNLTGSSCLARNFTLGWVITRTQTKQDFFLKFCQSPAKQETFWNCLGRLKLFLFENCSKKFEWCPISIKTPKHCGFSLNCRNLDVVISGPTYRLYGNSSIVWRLTSESTLNIFTGM